MIDDSTEAIWDGRRLGDVGAQQPRHDPPSHPLRPRPGQAGAPAGSVRRRPRPRAAPGPGGGAARAGPARRRLHLPGRRARPSRGRGPPRGRPRRPDLGALRSSRSAAATAAACRCRGRVPSRRSASAPVAAQPWLPQPTSWAQLTVEAQDATIRPATSRCTAPRCGSAASTRPSATDAWMGRPRRRRAVLRPGPGVPVRRQLRRRAVRAPGARRGAADQRAARGRSCRATPRRGCQCELSAASSAALIGPNDLGRSHRSEAGQGGQLVGRRRRRRGDRREVGIGADLRRQQRGGPGGRAPP